MTEELEPIDTGKYPKKRARKARNLGKLHARLILGLPDWVDEDGLLRVYDLARYLNVSYQAIYKWLSRERISGKRINALVFLSEQTENPPEGFEPLTHKSMTEFLG